MQSIWVDALVLHREGGGGMAGETAFGLYLAADCTAVGADSAAGIPPAEHELDVVCSRGLGMASASLLQRLCASEDPLFLTMAIAFARAC